MISKYGPLKLSVYGMFSINIHVQQKAFKFALNDVSIYLFQILSLKGFIFVGYLITSIYLSVYFQENNS